MRSFQCYQLAVQFYKLAKEAPLPSHLKNQFLRASSSITLNLAEGYGKSTMKDRRRVFQIAFGSIRECQSIIELEKNCFNFSEIDLLDYLAASTYKLIRNSS